MCTVKMLNAPHSGWLSLRLPRHITDTLSAMVMTAARRPEGVTRLHTMLDGEGIDHCRLLLLHTHARCVRWGAIAVLVLGCLDIFRLRAARSLQLLA